MAFFLPGPLWLACAALAGAILAALLARAVAREDPRWFVLDEVAGYLWAVVGLPIAERPVLVLGAAFVLFRLFDILKPWPIRRLEKIPGGWGVVADDVMAGIYAHLLLRILLDFV